MANRPLQRRKRVAWTEHTCTVEIIRNKIRTAVYTDAVPNNVGINCSSFSEWDFFFPNILPRIRIFVFMQHCLPDWSFIPNICIHVNIAMLSTMLIRPLLVIEWLLCYLFLLRYSYLFEHPSSALPEYMWLSLQYKFHKVVIYSAGINVVVTQHVFFTYSNYVMCTGVGNSVSLF